MSSSPISLFRFFSYYRNTFSLVGYLVGSSVQILSQLETPIMSVSNTSNAPTLHGGYISLETVLTKTDVSNRRTKIICTLGPASWSEEGLGTLIDSGMNVARFNFSHGDHESHAAVLARLRKVAAQKSRNIAVLLDTKGPEIRSGTYTFPSSQTNTQLVLIEHPFHCCLFLSLHGTGFFKDGVSKIDLKKGETLVLTTDYNYKGDSKKLACSYPELAETVTAGQAILVADGSLVLTVLSIDRSVSEVSCRIENNCTIGERKNMNLPGAVVALPTFTEKDVNGE